MDRLACVDLPILPLQLLLRRNRDWSEHPVAVVLEDRPQGTILAVNERARQRGVLTGMKYASGLSLAPGLRAAVVEPEEIAAAVEQLMELLRDFSPNVQPSEDEPGVLWVDASGLGRLWKSLSSWGEAIADRLAKEGWLASVVVGFSRFRTYAIARTRIKGRRRLMILGDAEAERRLCTTVSLDRLGLQSKARDGLAKLGIRTVGDLLRLPAAGVMRRFGPEAQRLWRLASGDRRPKLQAKAVVAPVAAVTHLDHGTSKATILLFMVKRLLGGLITTLAQRHEVMAVLEMVFVLEKGRDRREEIRPAEATLDEKILMDLVRLRLERMKLSSEVMDIRLDAQGTAATNDQLRMYFDRPKRDLRAAHMALARLRAEIGDHSVQRAVLKPGHLPEAQFSWEPLSSLPERAALPTEPPRTAAQIGGQNERMLIRRLLPSPRALPPQSRHVRDDGWLVNGLQYGSVVRSTGPYLVSGGWWRKEVHREYQFAETQRGDLLWIYYDRQRRRWYLHGIVE